MDRRSWLWRRKSSEKGPGETESSGSISSLYEKFSDDQVYPTHNSQSPEVTSKAANSDEEVNDNMKALREKLSAALLNISAKEDLVKQHAKVAEEAVSGWEKAENEVLILNQQLEAATQKNSAVEERNDHLDGALKECVRQLWQAREEQERKIQEAVSKTTREWEFTKFNLESQLVEIQAQNRDAKTESDASNDPDLLRKLKALEKENSALKLVVLSQKEELEIRISERDLTIKAAETASKQHLDSINKVVKLESECRRLNSLARKVSTTNERRLFTASSVSVESFTDIQSDCGDRLLPVETDIHIVSGLDLKKCEPSEFGSCASALIKEYHQNEKACGRNPMVPLAEISLMDDFLEMEKLAALPDTESGSNHVEAGSLSNQRTSDEITLKAEVEGMINRNAALEEKLEKMEEEKVELQMALTECHKQLETSESQLKEAEVKLAMLQTELALTDESKKAAEEEIKATNTKREVAESQLRVVEAEMESLLSKVGSLEEVIEKERTLCAESFAKCRNMEDEVLRLKHEKLQREAEVQRVTSSNADLMIKQELAVAASRFAECQKTISNLGQQLKSLATLEDFLIDSGKPLDGKCLKNLVEPCKLQAAF